MHAADLQIPDGADNLSLQYQGYLGGRDDYQGPASAPLIRCQQYGCDCMECLGSWIPAKSMSQDFSQRRMSESPAAPSAFGRCVIHPGIDVPPLTNESNIGKVRRRILRRVDYDGRWEDDRETKEQKTTYRVRSQYVLAHVLDSCCLGQLGRLLGRASSASGSLGALCRCSCKKYREIYNGCWLLMQQKAHRISNEDELILQ
ncbi:hypothetical protein M8818_005386 [Zalaria obscura]|uniref:Uncharacterized protein n=1 Tax=Zalaria obscura TaxID=2024903 RepID=A0ACC3S8D3_9PEZI